MKRPVLYSTNTYLKFRICRDFRDDIHHAWCTDVFDSDTLGDYVAGSRQPPTANPVDIYWDLKRAIEKQDRHNAKLLNQKEILSDLIKEWRNQGEIKPWQRDEISKYIDFASLNDWTPLIYVIPRCLVKGRLELAPVEKRASLEWEYQIRNLNRSEFDIIELKRNRKGGGP